MLQHFEGMKSICYTQQPTFEYYSCSQLILTFPYYKDIREIQSENPLKIAEYC